MQLLAGSNHKRASARRWSKVSLRAASAEGDQQQFHAFRPPSASKLAEVAEQPDQRRTRSALVSEAPAATRARLE